MTKLNQQTIERLLSDFPLPYLNRDALSAKVLREITISGSALDIKIELGFPIARVEAEFTKTMQDFLRAALNIQEVHVTVLSKIRSHQVQPHLKGLGVVKNIIAIGSGKGGVGKSTTALNIALALQQLGAQVGLLDADIYGPNQPHMLGTQEKPEIKSQNHIEPVMRHGLQTMSMGYLVNATTPMIWRGPMVSSALQQLLRDTKWRDLDYLIIDLPPGTGDIQLTLAQKIPVSGAAVVTTPQDVALLDARKGLEMFQKVNVSVLGLIENMSAFHCSHCGHETALFGHGGGAKMARECDVPLLGQVPLAIEIRQLLDQGKSPVLENPESVIAKNYRDIALRLTAELSMKPIHYASKFPNIVVE
jgi:ATP-binding protein involved in chromosome partitioning